MKRPRILLADEHSYFSELVEELLEPTYEVIGKVRDGRSLREAALQLKPDVIITDISMPIHNGIETVEELQRMGCHSKVIFLTVDSDADFICRCFASGAFGYIVKERLAIDLLRAVQEVLGGHLFISPHDGKDSPCNATESS